MNNKSLNRVHRGVPQGGEFAHKQTQEGVPLVVPTPQSDIEPMSTFAFVFEEVNAVERPEDLWPYVEHEHRAVRSHVALSERLTQEQFKRLISDREWIVRLSAAERIDFPSELNDAASVETEPLVLLRYLDNPTLSSDNRKKILSDSGAQTAMESMNIGIRNFFNSNPHLKPSVGTVMEEISAYSF